MSNASFSRILRQIEQKAREYFRSIKYILKKPYLYPSYTVSAWWLVSYLISLSARCITEMAARARQPQWATNQRACGTHSTDSPFMTLLSLCLTLTSCVGRRRKWRHMSNVHSTPDDRCRIWRENSSICLSDRSIDGERWLVRSNSVQRAARRAMDVRYRWEECMDSPTILSGPSHKKSKSADTCRILKVNERRAFQMRPEYFRNIPKVHVLTIRKSREVGLECAAGCISRLWPSHGCMH